MKQLRNLFLIIVFAYVVGYVRCVVKFVQCDFAPSYKAEVIYGAGVFTGLGGVVGWFDIGK